MGVAGRLEERGLRIPPPQIVPAGVRLTYRRLVRWEDIAYVAGHGPTHGEGCDHPGGAVHGARAGATLDHRQHDLAWIDGDGDAGERAGPRGRRIDNHGNAAEWRLGIPLGRLAEPSDQAALALFLAGDGARHITGQNLTVDGGQTIG